MSATKRFSDEWAIVGTIDPIDANNADSNSDIIDMSLYSEIAVIAMLGVINASATFDLALYEDDDSAFGSGAAISGKSLTQLTGAGSDGAKQAIIELKAEELSAGARYVRAQMLNSAHSQLAAVLILGRAKYQPARDSDLSSVDEIVF